MGDRKDDNEIPEIVGTKDLRESFKEHGSIRGSFFINNVELHQFEAHNPEGLVAALNARSSQTFVNASLDEENHLVLEAQSPAPILLRSGAPYVETPAAGDQQAHAIGDAVKKAIDASKPADQRKEDRKKNDVLELMGLSEAAKEQDEKQKQEAKESRGDRDPAKERRMARHQRAVAAGAIRAMPEDLAKEQTQAPQQGRQGSRPVPQGAGADGPDEQRRFNPVTPSDYQPPPNPATRQNNPNFQLAPSTNSDHQPYVGEIPKDDAEPANDVRHPS